MIATFVLLMPIIAYGFLYVKSVADVVALPSLVSVIFLTWLAPQLYFVQIQEPQIFAATTMFGAFGALCFVALAAGFRYGCATANIRSTSKKVITFSVLVMSIISISLNIRYISAISDNRDVSQWSGAGTIIAFFSSIRFFVFPISAIAFFKRPSTLLGAILLVNLYVAILIAFGELRRSDVISFVLILLLVYFFARGKLPPLMFFAIFVPFAIIIIFGISELRSAHKAALESDGSIIDVLLNGSIREINFGTALIDSISLAPDVRNGSYIIQYCIETFKFRLGAELWNDMVWQYVPAQFVGASFKQSLLLGDRVSVYVDMINQFGYYRSPGSTRTGIGSAFLDFGPFGAIYFYIIGLLCGRTYSKALSGDMISQALYISLLAPVLISFTHSHSYFFTIFPLLLTCRIALGTLRFRARPKRSAFPTRHIGM